MTFNANLLLRKKVGKGLCKSLLAEADFLSSAIYSSECF